MVLCVVLLCAWSFVSVLYVFCNVNLLRTCACLYGVLYDALCTLLCDFCYMIFCECVPRVCAPFHRAVIRLFVLLSAVSVPVM